jgi:hypothetical protein
MLYNDPVKLYIMITSQKELLNVSILKYVYVALKQKYKSFIKPKASANQPSSSLFYHRFKSNASHTDHDQWNGARLLSLKELHAKAAANKTTE